MPGLYYTMRDSGSRMINPLHHFPCDTYEDYEQNPIVLDLLMNQIAQPYTRSSGAQPSPTGGQSFVGYLQQALANVYQALQINDLAWLQARIEDVLALYRRAAQLLRTENGLDPGQNIHFLIIAMAEKFLPLLANLDINFAWELIESVYLISDKEEAVLRFLLVAVPQQQYPALLAKASQILNSEPDYLAQNIVALFTGGRVDYPHY